MLITQLFPLKDKVFNMLTPHVRDFLLMVLSESFNVALKKSTFLLKLFPFPLGLLEVFMC